MARHNRSVLLCIGVLLGIGGLMLMADSLWGQSPERRQGGRGGGFGQGGFGQRGFGPGGFGQGGFGPGGFGQGGFGGFGGGGFDRNGNLMIILGRDDVKNELKLSDEQNQKIEDLSGQSVSGFAEMRPFFDKMRNAQTDEERQAARDEMRKAQEQSQQKIQEDVKRILSPEQFARLEQVQLQLRGTRALQDDTVADDLGLSEDQKDQLDKIANDQSEAMRSLGRDGSDEERQALRDEYNQKLLAVLTPAQREAWDGRLGTPFEGAASDSGRGNRGRSSGARRAISTAPPVRRAIPTDPGSIDIRPDTGEPKTEAVVATFDPGAVVPDSAQGGTAPRTTPVSKMSFRFQGAAWGDVLKRYAEVAGLSLDFSTALPPGTFSYWDDGEYSPVEALDIINGALIPRGYILVQRDKALVVWNLDDPTQIPPPLVPHVSVDELLKRGKNELLRIVLPVSGVTAETAAKEMEPLLSPFGKAAPLSQLGRVEVMDVGSVLREIVKNFGGGEIGAGGTALKAFALRNIPAEEAESIVRDLFGLPQRGAATTSSGGTASSNSSRFGDFGGFPFFGSRGRTGSSRFGSSDSGSSRGSTSSTQTTTATPANSKEAPVQVAVDYRTNTLFVKASAADLSYVQQVVDAIDVSAVNPIAQAFRSSAPYDHVYEVKSASVEAVVRSLNTRFPGTVVTDDREANRVTVHATPSQHREIAELVSMMDGSSQKVSVFIPLSVLDANQATVNLQSLYAGEGTEAPTIQPDIRGRSLLVRGTQDQVAQIKALLSDMGDPLTGVRPDSARGPVRQIPLGNRDPQQMLQLIEQFWNASGRNPLQVIPDRSQQPETTTRPQVPNADSRTERLDRPRQRGVGADQARERPSSLTRTSNDGTRGRVLRSAVFQPDSATDRPWFTRVAQSDERPAGREAVIELEDTLQQLKPSADAPNGDSSAPKQAAPPNASPEPQADSGEGQRKPGIMVQQRGDDLVIISKDIEALDELENMVEMLTKIVEPKTIWTVFYLRASDCVETAATLEKIFPSSSVQTPTSGSDGLFGGLSNLTSNLADATGLSQLGVGPQTLKIIPVENLNALLVTGPAYTVREVENMLKILDSNELPPSLRERVPRMIPVEYADVTDVAEIVKETFKDSVDPNAGGAALANAARGNPFAAMMMGGNSNNGGSRSSRQSQGIELTVSADVRTNTLVVSANEPLFRQVESLVHSLDEVAYDANRTVKVVQLQNSNSTVIQQALASLLPKVTVTTTASPSASTSSSSSSRPSSSSPFGAPASPEDFQRMMEQRMRDRASSGGGFGRDRRGSGGFGGFGGGNGGSGRGFGGGDSGSSGGSSRSRSRSRGGR